MSSLGASHDPERNEDLPGRGPGTRAIPGGHRLVRGTAGAAGDLKAQLPWLRVFVEGVVIVGKLEN